MAAAMRARAEGFIAVSRFERAADMVAHAARAPVRCTARPLGGDGKNAPVDPRAALRWFELHSEVDIRHAEEAITVIQDYTEFHQISDALFNQIAGFTLGDKLFCRHYFPPRSRLITRSKAPQLLRVDALTIYRLRIPFHQAFSHALHSREESDAIIVKVSGSDGRSGFGEALPRAYVTGETSENMIGRIRDFLAPRVFQENFSPGWQTMEQVQSLLPDWTSNSDLNNGVIAWNAAFCAVELAILDWSLRADHSSLADYLPPTRFEVVYSGVISADSAKDAAALAKRMAGLGITQIKVKVGTADDGARLDAVRKAVGYSVELRADANGAWSATQAIEQLKLLEPFKLALIEQPVAAGDIAGMKQVRRECAIPVMADESLVTADQARRLVEASACDLFNIRLSKNGGIAGSLAIVPSMENTPSVAIRRNRLAFASCSFASRSTGSMFSMPSAPSKRTKRS
jgi:muconate cycloisomerase